jgi:hypothetical protein
MATGDPMTTMIACLDCRHLLVPVIDDEGTRGREQCGHPKALVEVPDFLTGGSTTVRMSIEIMRSLGDCGLDAKLFEPKQGH